MIEQHVSVRKAGCDAAGDFVRLAGTGVPMPRVTAPYELKSCMEEGRGITRGAVEIAWMDQQTVQRKKREV